MALLVMTAALMSACVVAEARGPEVEATPVLTPTATVLPEGASPTPVTTAGPSDVSPTPASTRRPLTSVSLEVTSLVCERFYPGVPDPDGTDEWFNVRVEVKNAGSRNVALREPAIAQVRVPGGAEGGMMTVNIDLPVSVLEPGATYQFSGSNLAAPLPGAHTCQVIFMPAEDGVFLIMAGTSQAEITTTAAP